MPLSEDLVLIEAFVSVVGAGEHELTPAGCAELQALLARAAEDAARLEDALDDALERARDGRRPAAPSAALAAAVRSGKVVRLAARRVASLPALAGPGGAA